MANRRNDIYRIGGIRLHVSLGGPSVMAWVKRERQPIGYAFTGLVFLVWLFCLPDPLFNDPLSTVLEDRSGRLLGARIAEDGQWRFPPPDSVPYRYAQCLVAFEDRRFYFHPGVDPAGIARAIWQNLRAGKVVSGGSTLTMQVIRMSRHNPPRSFWQKAVEIFLATRLEFRATKKDILRHYAANAPFGGNVVGLEAASWRYFGKEPAALSWSEAAVLAVLPNSPALIHPGRNRQKLLEKRNRLLQSLIDRQIIPQTTGELAMAEPLPEKPSPLPQLAPRLLDRLAMQKAQRYQVTLDGSLQRLVTGILDRHHQLLKGNGVNNLAAMVIEVESGEVLAYVGNTSQAGKEHHNQVDIIRAPRSTGSILKPYLYALALQSGDILPESLLRDVPTQLGNYTPENYLETYDGAVSAKRALIRSLNVPFVLLLKQYGLERFHFGLQQLGISTLTKAPSHYGLTLVVGGAEANLEDVTNIYACMARRLGGFYRRNSRYDLDDFRPPVYLAQPRIRRERLTRNANILSAGAIWFAFDAMKEVERPDASGNWEVFPSTSLVAWKTGTSYGFRDAWAAGATPGYAVGVWAGNADGEGRPGLVGVQAAAPVLFDIFDVLPNTGWFDPPYDDMVMTPVCRQSGMRAGKRCEADSTWIPVSGLRSEVCQYHQLLHLDPTGQWQVHADCEAAASIRHEPWFVLPPLEEYYFVSKNPGYLKPPPIRPDCLGASDQQAAQRPMQLIYPKHATRIYVPVDLDGKLSSTVFQVAHRRPGTEIYWHLDGSYLGSTTDFHQMPLQPPVGKHVLTLVDADGYRLEQPFEIIGKE